MKNFNLSVLTNALSRNEMREVIGGGFISSECAYDNSGNSHGIFATAKCICQHENGIWNEHCDRCESRDPYFSPPGC